MPRHDYQVRRVGESGSTVHYRVSAGAKGGPEVTVRVGWQGVFACLGCVSVTCEHVPAAREFAETEATAQPSHSTPEAAA